MSLCLSNKEKINKNLKVNLKKNLEESGERPSLFSIFFDCEQQQCVCSACNVVASSAYRHFKIVFMSIVALKLLQSLYLLLELVI